jgi:hypothetical protein
MRALRGAAQNPVDPQRLASWMLEGGGALEAFEALEVAAMTDDDPLDPLVRDVAAVLLGPGAGYGTPPVESTATDTRQVPTVGDVAAALRTLEAAALVYLHPLEGRPCTAGVLLLDASTERLDLLGTVVVPDPTAAMPPVDWHAAVWTTLVEPLLYQHIADTVPLRVLVVATGELGRLPLPAISTGAGRYAAGDLIVSHVASGRQVVDLARRTPLPVTDDVVFIANPRGDRDSATFEAMALRRIFYPRSTGLGHTVEQVDGAGTVNDVLAHLPGPTGPGAGLLHLGCGLRTAGTPALELAGPGGACSESGPDLLDVERIAGQAAGRLDLGSGGLAILPADMGAHHDQWVRFADTLLDAGLTGVIGWGWPVPEQIAALMLFVLHGKLAGEELPPSAAVHGVHRWMLDPRRVEPPYLPVWLAATLTRADLTDPVHWAALCHRGR